MTHKLLPQWRNGIPYLANNQVQGYIDDPFLDPEIEQIWWGKTLPHLYQPWKIVFITIRLIDSLPKNARYDISEMIKKIRNRIEREIRDTNESHSEILYKTLTSRFNKYLDEGSGSCILKNPAYRKIIEEVIKEKDGYEYWVISYVIMPNHVHLLIRPFGVKKLEDIMDRIKSLSARHILQQMNESSNPIIWEYDGIWFKNYFDRTMRSYPHFLYTVQYIRNNPRNLWSTDYTLGGPSAMFTGR